jgi:hypothetical protein
MKIANQLVLVSAAIVLTINGCATGGSVEVGDVDVSPCVNLPGASSRDCKTKEN